jgi:hypothetical protein
LQMNANIAKGAAGETYIRGEGPRPNELGYVALTDGFNSEQTLRHQFHLLLVL